MLRKGGINIKKIFLIFTTIIISILNTLNVKAETANFYEAEYIDNVYISKYQYSTHITYYQKARIFRKNDTNEIAYCIEPFNLFNKDSSYESTINPNNIPKEKIELIKRIAYYGYGYKNHNDVKWYAITQYLIWKEVTNDGKIYFTDKLNGNEIEPFNNEISEIYGLIGDNQKTPSFINNTYTIVEDKELILNDNNNVLNYYETDNHIIKDNNLIIKNLKKGDYTINLTKKYKTYYKPYIFYQSQNSQNLIKTGNIEDENIRLNIKVINTNINIKKIDYDKKDIYPQGESSLNNAIIGIYDKEMNLINQVEILNNTAVINNLDFGTYYLKELKPGIGYNLNNKIYEINITKENYMQDITIENMVIKKKITLEKKYGENNNLNNEPNIYFEIYDKNKNLINTIKTNDLGIAEITLPYGNYLIKQINSTLGYQKVEPFNISVTNNQDELIELKDYKIKVPNTHKDKNNIIHIILLLIILLRI